MQRHSQPSSLLFSFLSSLIVVVACVWGWGVTVPRHTEHTPHPEPPPRGGAGVARLLLAYAVSARNVAQRRRRFASSITFRHTGIPGTEIPIQAEQPTMPRPRRLREVQTATWQTSRDAAAVMFVERLFCEPRHSSTCRICFLPYMVAEDRFRAAPRQACRQKHTRFGRLHHISMVRDQRSVAALRAAPRPVLPASVQSVGRRATPSPAPLCHYVIATLNERYIEFQRIHYDSYITRAPMRL